MSLPANCDVLINEAEIEKNLEIPEPIVIKQNGKDFYAWDSNGFRIILKVFNGYSLWADNYEANKELINVFNLRIEICNQRLALKDEVISQLREDRKQIYDLFNAERDKKSKEEKKNVLKNIGLILSSGVIGIAVGIIVGIVLVK